MVVLPQEVARRDAAASLSRETDSGVQPAYGRRRSPCGKGWELTGPIRCRRCRLFDLAGVTLVDEVIGEPDVVVFGGAGAAFGYETLNQVFRHLQRGARLVAMHRNLYWRTATGLDLDTGAFLLGLERAARVEAEITGKPAEAFFASALAHVGATPSEALMVGDDIESDVLAAQRHGITGVLVKTGKYLPETHRAADGTPDHVLDSFGDLPALLERLGLSRDRERPTPGTSG